MLRSIALQFLLVAVFSAGAMSQSKDLAAPSENLSRPELEKWITQSMTKHAKYETGTTSVTVSSAKIDQCRLSFNFVRKPRAIEIASDRTVYRTERVTDAVAIDMSQIEPGTITVEEYLDPDLKTVAIKLDEFAKTEIVVRRQAAEAIRIALDRLRGACFRRP